MRETHLHLQDACKASVNLVTAVALYHCTSKLAWHAPVLKLQRELCFLAHAVYILCWQHQYHLPVQLELDIVKSSLLEGDALAHRSVMSHG